jgi:hypothetical protein
MASIIVDKLKDPQKIGQWEEGETPKQATGKSFPPLDLK